VLKRDPKGRFVCNETGILFKKRVWRFHSGNKSASAADTVNCLAGIPEPRNSESEYDKVKYRDPDTGEWLVGIPEPHKGNVEYLDPYTGEWLFGIPEPSQISRKLVVHHRTELDDESYNSLLAHQQHTPVVVMSDGSSRKRWWMFKGDFYSEDEGYSETEVKALVLDGMQQKERKVQRALARLNQSGAESSAARQLIPNDVKIFVWQRDEGRCVNCGSREKLEFDHIIPRVKGGGNSHRNLQLLCENCNRSKGGNIV